MNTEGEKNHGEPKDPIDIEIEQEIEEYKKRHGEGWRFILTNNLYMYTPGGYRRKYDPDIRENDETASEKRRSQSLGEFIVVVDQTLEEMGISEDKLKEERKKNDAGKESRFLDIMVDLYIRLRKKGYNRYPDLVR